MDMYCVIKKKPDGLVSYIFSSLESAIQTFPQIAAWKEFYWEMDLPYGMNIEDYLNVKKCLVY